MELQEIETQQPGIEKPEQEELRQKATDSKKSYQEKHCWGTDGVGDHSRSPESGRSKIRGRDAKSPREAHGEAEGQETGRAEEAVDPEAIA